MLILIIPIIIFIILILVFLLIAHNYIKTLSNKSRIKLNENPEEILLNINSSHSYSSDIDYQYESINQLLSILSQLILLIFLFLSSLSIYFHPLYSFQLRFENIIYSHLYGFFVLFLAFYILAFYILSRSNLIKNYYFNRKKNDQSSFLINSINNKQYDIHSSTDQISTLPPSHSHYSSNKDTCEISQTSIINNDHVCIEKRLSICYICHHLRKSNTSQNIPNDTMPISSSDTSSQE